MSAVSFTRWLPYVFGTALLALSVWLYFSLSYQDERRVREINQLALQNYVNQLTSNLDFRINGFGRMARRWEMGAYATIDLWRADVANYAQDMPGIRAVAFIDPMFVVRQIYPQGGNEKLRDYDLKQIPEAFQSLELARKKGQVTATSVIDLQNGRKEFVVFVPMYRGTKNIGFIAPIIDVNEYFTSSSFFMGYFVKVKSFDKELFELDRLQGLEVSNLKISLERYLQMGETWTFEVYPSKKMLYSQRSALPTIVLLAGIIFTFLVSYTSYLYLAMSSKESEVRELSEWQTAILNASSLMFVSVDNSGIIRSINRSVTDLLGYTENDLIGKLTPEFWHLENEVRAHRGFIEKRYRCQLPSDFDSFLFESRQGISNKYEFNIKAKSGRIVPFLLEVYCLRSDRGAIRGYVGILEDLSLRKQQEQQIRDQEMRVITSTRLASLGEMAAGIGHEINNPLAIITANLAILKKKVVPSPEVDLRIQKIEATTQRIADIVRGLRNLSRREVTGEAPQVGSVREVVNDAVNICSERFKNHNIQMQLEEIPEDWTFEGYPYQISQLLLNLLNNAHDAVYQAQDPWIRIEVLKNENHVYFSVEDSGPGLSKDMKDKLFQPFFTTKEVGKGLGLGLSISDSIAKRHGGRLYLDPRSSRTKFVLEIPTVAGFKHHHS